jgi:hypothetical protein
MNNNCITPDELYSKLPHGTFYYEHEFDVIRDYSPSQRFPKPKYELCDVLVAWYALIYDGRISVIDPGLAEKL